MPHLRRLPALALALALLAASPALPESSGIEIGGDTFVAGGAVTETFDTSGDTFLAARSATARGVSAGDLHVAGFDVSVSTDVAEDLYAAGASLTLRGTVAHDLTAAGFSVRTESGAQTRGNARLFGNSVTIEGPVSGALMATGVDVILNAPVAGDVRIVASTLSFGPEATIGGVLTYSMDREITVPEQVVPAERVRFEQIRIDDAWDGLDEVRREMPFLPAFMTMLSGFVISLLFFLALGALMLAFMPKRLSALRKNVTDAPGQSIVLGLIGLSVLFGAVPITALTIVGLPFVPIAILAIVAAWTLGYALGAYSLAMYVWAGLRGEEEPGRGTRLLVFGAGIACVALLNFIPFIGWMANYTLVLLGIGAMTRAVFVSMLGNTGAALDVDMRPLDD